MKSGPDMELSRREREVMDIVYAMDPVSAADVRQAMESPPTDAAVRATLRALVEKGHLRIEQDGPRYLYRPTVSRTRARRKALQRLLQTFFGGSVESAMAALLELPTARLSNDDRERLKRLIDEAEREGR